MIVWQEMNPGIDFDAALLGGHFIHFQVPPCGAFNCPYMTFGLFFQTIGKTGTEKLK